jgi:hypothetical protein
VIVRNIHHGRAKARVFALDVPAIHVFSSRYAVKNWMPGIADKFTQSAQSKLLWPA